MTSEHSPACPLYPARVSPRTPVLREDCSRCCDVGGALGEEHWGATDNLGHIQAFDSSVAGFYQTATKCLCLKQWRWVEWPRKVTYEEIQRLYDWHNSVIRCRSKFSAKTLGNKLVLISTRVREVTQMFKQVSTLRDEVKRYKGNIESCGGHLPRDVFFRGICGVEGFLMPDAEACWHCS